MGRSRRSIDNQKVKKKDPNSGFHDKSLKERILSEPRISHGLVLAIGLSAGVATGILIDYYDAQTEVSKVKKEVCDEIKEASRD